MRSKKNKSGFTLVELMIVAVIVAILAAVAIPLMSANRTRAMATEAESALGTIRSSLRAAYAETGAYNLGPGGAIVVGAVAGNVPGISAGDLNGKYFVDANYTITAIGAAAYNIRATGAGDVAGVVINLDQNGDFTRTFP